ncbi:MAG TPA: HEAT repeat domain-containing protein [Schlesneria sp.]
MIRHITINLLLILAARASIAHREFRSLVDLFDRMTFLTGTEYVEKRNGLLHHPRAEAVLITIQKNQKRTEEARWLAAILLDRLHQPEEFERLTLAWRNRALTPSAGRVIVSSANWSPIVPANQKPPDFAARKAKGLSEDERINLKNEIAREAERYKEKHLPDSLLWTSIFGEVLLQRLGPDVAWPRVENMPADESEEMRPEPPEKPVNLSHCLIDAIIVLAANKERRATGEVVRIIEAKETGQLTRRHAIVALGMIGDPRSCDCLKHILGSAKYANDLRINAAKSIALLNCPDALEVLRALHAVTSDQDMKTEIEQAILAIEQEAR